MFSCGFVGPKGAGSWMKGVTRVSCLLASGALAAIGVGACANGGPSVADGPGDAAASADSASTPDALADGGADANVHDATASADSPSTPDALADGPDEADDDAGDASDDAGDAGSVGFGASCAPPSVYSDPFTTNPLTSGWTTVVGTATYEPGDAGDGLLALATGNPNAQVWIGPRAAWTDYTISVAVRIDSQGSNGNGGINFRMDSVGVANNAGQMYFVGLSTSDLIIGIENGNWTQYANTPGTFAVGVFYTVTVTATGDQLSASVAAPGGSTTTVSYTTTDAGANTDFATGSFGFRTYNMGMTYGPVTVTCE